MCTFNGVLPICTPITGRALEMLTTGNRMGAEEAYRLGLVDHLVDSLDALMPKCEAIANEVSCRKSFPG